MDPVEGTAAARALGRIHSAVSLRMVRDYGILFVLLSLFIVLSLASSAFLTSDNLLNLADQWAPTGLVALGMTFVFIAGGFDLSAGVVFALSGIVAAKVANSTDAATGIAAGCLTGAIAGAANGVLITAGKINAFIATLATSIIAGGITLAITHGQIVPISAGGFKTLERGELIGIKYPVLIFALAVILGAVLLHRTAFGRYVYAVGGNPEAARLSGIRVGLTKTMTYVTVGALAGLGGTILAARLSSATPEAGGYSLVFSVFTAVILGGTSIAGGFGAIWRTVVGLMLIALMGNGFNLLNVDTVYQEIIFGAIILAAVWIDQLSRPSAEAL
jgi:ribose transport system permease protein